MKCVLTLSALIAATATFAQGGGVNLNDWYVLGETGGQIYRYDLQTGQPVVIVPATSGYYPAPQDYFAPSGLVLYVLDSGTGYRHLWLTDIEGSFRRQLTTFGENDAAKFSPDGTKFIFVHSDTSIYSNKSVEVYDLSTDQITQVVPPTENVSYGAAFMPDGNGFVYGTGWGTNLETLKWKKANGSVWVIGSAKTLGLMSISPDQSEVAFHSNDFGAYRVERMNMSNGTLSSGPAYGLAGNSYFPDGSFAYDYGSVQRYLPSTGQSTLLVGADLSRPVVGPKSRTTSYPISYTVASGYDANGELADLYASDDRRLCFFADDLTLVAEVNINGRSWKTAPDTLSFTLETQVARAGLSQTLRLRNYAQGTYVVADGRVAAGTDVTVSVSFTSTAPEYVGPGGAMRARVTWSPINDEAPSQDGWLHCIDMAKWTIQ